MTNLERDKLEKDNYDKSNLKKDNSEREKLQKEDHGTPCRCFDSSVDTLAQSQDTIVTLQNRTVAVRAKLDVTSGHIKTWYNKRNVVSSKQYR